MRSKDFKDRGAVGGDAEEAELDSGSWTGALSQRGSGIVRRVAAGETT